MAEEKLSLFQKLLKARLEFADLKQSGFNDFSKYRYFELKDFLPKINEVNAELGIFAYVSFTREMATLTMINIESPEDQLIFTSPMAGASLKGCHEIQNLGAVESYQRRYLYMTAYEISEPDALDKGESEQQTKQTPEQIRNQLVIDWGKRRSRLQELGKDVHNQKTNDYICTKAEVATQEVEKLNNEQLKTLTDVYAEMINTLSGGKG